MPAPQVEFRTVPAECPTCAPAHRDRRAVSRAALDTLDELSLGELPAVSGEVRQLLAHTVSTVLGRRPRLLSYLT